jgi:N-acetyl sugar amidotransferase
MSAGYRQCSRCVMDTSDPEIAFDDAGHCNHCTGFLARSRVRSSDPQLRLAEQVEAMKLAGRSSRYDCIVGVSGGADSSYAAYVAWSHGLRVLAVHMDNGWNTALAVRNVKTVVERLGVDYVSAVLDWEEFKDLQLAFLKAGVPEIETPTDIAIPAALHRVAAEHGVKHIVAGGNPWTEGILPSAWHYDAKDLKYIRAIHRRFGQRVLRTFPTFGYREESYYKLVKGIRFVYPLENVDYTTATATKTLQDDLGWQRPSGKHHESTITRFVQSYILPVKFNIDYRRATFSAEICAGAIARDWALAELEKSPFEPEQIELDKRYVAKKFGLTVPALEALIFSPPKWYRDYPNDKVFLERLYGLYRKHFSERRKQSSASAGA